jgi:hypothetical protein
MMIKKYAEGGTEPRKKATKTVVNKPAQPVESSTATKVLRNVLPLPMPMAQMVASTITRDNQFGWGDLRPTEQYELARSVMNARKRTGLNRGGTEYIDYSPEVSKDMQSLRGSAGNVGLGSVFSPELRTATTMGRVSYNYDPANDTYTVYDSYDFSPTQATNSAYGVVRSAAGKVGVMDGEPNVVARFKGSDYMGGRPTDGTGGSTYKDIQEFTGGITSGIKGLYNKLTDYMDFSKGGKVKYRPKLPIKK